MYLENGIQQRCDLLNSYIKFLMDPDFKLGPWALQLSLYTLFWSQTV